eukprot:631056-Amphidinium_carterae.1
MNHDCDTMCGSLIQIPSSESCHTHQIHVRSQPPVQTDPIHRRATDSGRATAVSSLPRLLR